MRAVFNKLLFLVIFFYLSWKGLDGLLINYHSQSLFEVDINDLEVNGIDHQRYLKVNNGIAYGTYVYLEESSYSEIDIIYPLLSAEKLAHLYNGDTIEAHLFIKRNKLNRNCLGDNSCFYQDSVSITGLTLSGFDNLSSEEVELLEDTHVKASNNSIVLEAGATPVQLHWNLAMFIGGLVFGSTILKSFFRSANSIKEYWDKITEIDPS